MLKARHPLAGITCIAAGVLSFAGAAAAEPAQLQKIFPNDGPFLLGTEQFGGPVAVEGDTMAVGSIVFSDVDAKSGAVFMYERDTTGAWTLHSILTPHDSAPDDWFIRLALKGDTLVVGAEGMENDEGREGAGKAYVFERDEMGDWLQTAVLLPTGAVDTTPGPGIAFGAGVAFDGETIAIGAPGDDEVSGAVFLFHRTPGGEWEQTQKLTSLSNSGGFGGASLAIDGDVLVAGCPAANTPAGFLSGAAFFFVRDEHGVWGFDLIIPPMPFVYGAFGTSVGVSGDSIVVGGINLGAALGINNDPGRAWFYRRNHGTGGWDLVQSIMDSEADGGDFYGAVVKINGDTAAIGSLGADGAQANTGAAFILHRDSVTGMWSETVRITADDGLTGDSFAAVAFDGNTVVVGATGVANPEQIGAVGAVYIFDLDPAPSPDLNDDGVVDGADLGLLLGAWGDCPLEGVCAADLNGDGVVDGADLGLLLGAWGSL